MNSQPKKKQRLEESNMEEEEEEEADQAFLPEERDEIFDTFMQTPEEANEKFHIQNKEGDMVEAYFRICFIVRWGGSLEQVRAIYDMCPSALEDPPTSNAVMIAACCLGASLEVIGFLAKRAPDALTENLFFEVLNTKANYERGETYLRDALDILLDAISPVPNNIAHTIISAASAIGVDLNLLSYLTQKLPTNSTSFSASALMLLGDNKENKTVGYMAEALGILIDACPSILALEHEEYEPGYIAGSFLGDSIGTEQDKRILDVIVNRCIAHNIFNTDLALAGCEISPTAARSLTPMLEAAKSFTMGVCIRDTEVGIQILDCLRSSMALETLLLTVQPMPSYDPSTKSWSVALKNLLCDQQKLKWLVIEFCDGTMAGSHDWLFGVLATCSSPNTSWGLIMRGNPHLASISTLNTFLLEGCHSRRTEMCFSESTHLLFDSWDPDLPARPSSNVNSLYMEIGNASKEWVRGFSSHIAQLDNLQSLHIHAEAPHDVTKLVSSLLEKGLMKDMTIVCESENTHFRADMKKVFMALRANRSLKFLSWDLVCSKEDTEALLDVLRDNNTTLLEIYKASLQPETPYWEQIEYFTLLNSFDRSKTHDPSFSIAELIASLVVVAEANDKKLRLSTLLDRRADEDEQSWLSRVVTHNKQRDSTMLGLTYGLLHGCVDLWSMKDLVPK